jgi:hypothetical protein
VFEEHTEDGEEHFKVVESARVGGWVVRHEEEEEAEDEELNAEGEPLPIVLAQDFKRLESMRLDEWWSYQIAPKTCRIRRDWAPT